MVAILCWGCDSLSPEKSLFLDKIDQVERCLELGLYYPALALALTLPDVCAQAAYGDNGQTNGWNYQHWIQEYVRTDQSLTEKEQMIYKVLGTPKEDQISMFLRGWDIYNLRCAYLHNGRGDPISSKGRSYYVSFNLSVIDEDYTMMTKEKNLARSGNSKTCAVANIGEICKLLCPAARKFYEGFDRKELLDNCNIIAHR